MKLTPEEVDELLNDGLDDPPKNFTDSVMARLDEPVAAIHQVSPSLVTQALRALALITGVGVGVSQMLRFVLGMYFVGAIH